MLLSLILGILLGGITVIFALQNTATVTVSFLTWQITAPLAFLLLATLLSGIAIMLLVLLPSLVRDEFYVRAIKRQKREVEDELAKMRVAKSPPSNTSTTVITEHEETRLSSVH